jgi:glycosyltransferase involved in cell wall biosynthesis
MNVCMVAYTFYASDARVMRYAEALARRGDQVDVIALRREGQPKKEIMNGVNVLRVQARSPNNGAKAAYIVEVLLFLFRAMVLVTRRHLRGRYQLVHIHSMPDFLVFAAWVPKLTGAKVILDIHDLLPEFYASKYGARQDSFACKFLVLMERLCGAFADHVIAANDLWQEKLTSRSFKNGKCTALVNVPDRAIFFRQGLTRADRKFIILYPGSLNWHQGLDLAIRAFSRIKNEVPEAEFHIYGEGRSQASLEQLIGELGLRDRVFIRPPVSARAIARVMENADLGVVPKRKDSFGDEAFSTKVTEFMAMGVPVIVSDTKVDCHYFNDSVVKFFRGGDEEDLARSMLLLVKQPELRNRLVRNALEYVEHNDWNVMKPKYLALVDSLVGERKPVSETRFIPAVLVPPQVLTSFRNLHALHLILTGCITLLFIADVMGLCPVPVAAYIPKWPES